MKKWLIIGLFLVLFCTMTYATDENYLFSTPPSVTNCQDFNTSIWSWTYTNVSNTSQWYSISKAFTCDPLGCNNITGTCNILDPISSSLEGIALLIVAFLFIIIAIKASSGFIFHGLNIEFMQPLFIVFAFLMVLASFTVMIVGSKVSQSISDILIASYNTAMWVFIFFISFMVLSFIINVIQNHLNKATKGKLG